MSVQPFNFYLHIYLFLFLSWRWSRGSLKIRTKMVFFTKMMIDTDLMAADSFSELTSPSSKLTENYSVLIHDDGWCVIPAVRTLSNNNVCIVSFYIAKFSTFMCRNKFYRCIAVYLLSYLKPLFYGEQEHPSRQWKIINKYQYLKSSLPFKIFQFFGYEIAEYYQVYLNPILVGPCTSY